MTEEVYCVPGIRDGDHHLGLLSTWPGMVNGVEYSQSLQYGGKFKIVETGEVIATAYPVPSQRNFCIDFNLSSRESPSEGFLKRISQARQAALSILPIESKIQLLHQRCNHMGVGRLYALLHSQLSSDCPLVANRNTLKIIQKIDCATCAIAKSQRAEHRHRHPELEKGHRQVTKEYLHPRGIKLGEFPFEFIAMDLKPLNVKAYTGETVLCAIKDLYTGRKFAIGLEFKGDELSELQAWYNYYVRGKRYQTKRIQFDRSKEQYNDAVFNWCAVNGITPRYNPSPDSPESNPAESGLDKIMVGTRTLMKHGGFPKAAWLLLAQAFCYVDYLMPSHSNVNDYSPYMMEHGSQPPIQHLRVIGSRAFAHDPLAVKFDDRAIEGVMIGYHEITKGYRILVDIIRGTTIETASVVFHELVPGVPHLIVRYTGHSLFPKMQVMFQDELEFEEQVVPVPPVSQIRETVPVISDYQTRSRGSVKVAVEATDIEEVYSHAFNMEEVYSHTFMEAETLRADAHPVVVQSSETDEDKENIPPEEPVLSYDGPDRLLYNVLNSESFINKLRMKMYRLSENDETEHQGESICRRIFKPKPKQPLLDVSALEDSSMAAELIGEAFVHRVSKYNKIFSVPRNEAARKAEIDDLLKNGKVMWVFEKDVPSWSQEIGYTYVVKDKSDPVTKEYQKTKVRLAPYGFQQIPGVSYDPDKVAAPTLSMEGFHLFIALVVKLKMKIMGMDVVSAFSIPNIEEYLIIKTPYGVEPPEPGMKMKLVSSLNGTKQAAYNWFRMQKEFMTSEGFKSLAFDSCFYYKWCGSELIIVILYVDDYCIGVNFGSDEGELFISRFSDKFPVKRNNGEAFLGINIEWTDAGDCILNVQKQFEAVLEAFNMAECSGSDTPCSPGSKISKCGPGEQDEESQKFPFRELVGCLLWPIRCARFDIKYSIGQLCSHMHLWNASAVAASKKLMRFIKRTLHWRHVFKYTDRPLALTLCTDSDFCGEPEGDNKAMRCMVSYAIFIEDSGCLMFTSHLGKTLSRSTMDAEYVAQSEGAAALVGFHNAFFELGLTVCLPSSDFTDNDATRRAVQSLMCSSKLRHIKLAHHYVRECVERRLIIVGRIDTDLNPSDIGTKALDKLGHRKHGQFVLRLDDPEGDYYRALGWKK